MVKILYFTANWCGPCRSFGPILESILGTELKGKAVLEKVDGDDFPEMVEEYMVRSFPTIVVLKDDTEVARHSGLVPKVRLLGVLEDAIN